MKQYVKAVDILLSVIFVVLTLVYLVEYFRQLYGINAIIIGILLTIFTLTIENFLNKKFKNKEVLLHSKSFIFTLIILVSIYLSVDQKTLNIDISFIDFLFSIFKSNTETFFKIAKYSQFTQFISYLLSAVCLRSFYKLANFFEKYLLNK